MKNVSCPACGLQGLDLARFDSMMVLSAKTALFTLRCPKCGTGVSAISKIPESLREEVQFAAISVGAGMGQEDRS